MTTTDLPVTIVVDENGNYWRAFDGFYSMCPVSTDNDPVKVAAIYTRLAATPAPLDVRVQEAYDAGYLAGAAFDPVIAATPAPLSADEIADNQAALESLPDAVQAVDFNLPPRVIVCEHGHYWRDYGDFLSMCPVSEDNLSCSPQTVYALVPDPSLHEMDIAAYSNAETVSSGNGAATPAPLPIEPYERECMVRDAEKGVAPAGSSMTRAEWDRRYLLERLAELRGGR
jgi:hypothetical protein